MSGTAAWWLASTPVSSSGPPLHLASLAMGLAGGLALFLFGMEMMSDSLKAVAGDRLRVVLQRLTKNRLIAAATGAFVTAVIQSSSVTTVMVVGFVTAGLMSVSQSIGVIMGANIGTTLTAQIIAFKVTKLALLMIAAGFAMTLVGKRERIRQQGAGLMGLGLVFFGMLVMSQAMEPLRSFQPFMDWMVRLETPLLGILAGTLFTALVQSSSATTGIVIVMAGQGLIALPAGIALAFGANIGTCVTALLASIGRPREALRASLVHVLFNVAGVLLWLPAIGWLTDFVVWLSPSAEALSGAARLAAETPRQIANAHTVFNVANTLLFLPLSTQFARLVEWMVPDRPLSEAELVRARYLDDELLSTPSLALDRARLELLHMGDQVRAMLAEVLPAMVRGSQEELDRVAVMDDKVDALYRQILAYLGRISGPKLTEGQTDELLKLMEATHSLENIGDIIETNLVRKGKERIAEGVVVSPSTEEVIVGLHTAVSSALNAALQSVAQKNVEAAHQVVAMKKEINRLVNSAAVHQAQRLVAEEPNRLPAYTVEMAFLRNLKRIYYFTKRMARALVPSVVVEEEG